MEVIGYLEVVALHLLDTVPDLRLLSNHEYTFYNEFTITRA